MRGNQSVHLTNGFPGRGQACRYGAEAVGGSDVERQHVDAAQKLIDGAMNLLRLAFAGAKTQLPNRD